MELVENLLTAHASSQSEALKSSCVYKLILRTVSQPMNSQECRKTFLKLTEWIIFSEYKFLRENALQGFDVLAENSSSIFLEIVDVEYFKMIFAKMNLTKPVNLIGLVMTIFSKLSKHSPLTHPSPDPVYRAVRASLILYLAHHGTDTIFLQSMEHLYTMFPTLLPASTPDITQLGNIVIHLHSSHTSTCQCDTRLDKLLSHVWSYCTDTTACLNTLLTVLRILSTADTFCPPACLSTILEAFPRGLLEQNLTVLLDQPHERLLLILTRLFGWLEVRAAPDLTDSVLKLVSVLGAGRGSLMASLSQTILLHLVQQVMEVVSSACRVQLVKLVLAMLYGGQQSPESFQSAIPLLPEVLSVLGVDFLWDARDSLLECAQYHRYLFPGVLNGSVLESVLQQEDMAKITPERRHQLSGFVWGYPGNFKLDRMQGQLVGLINLGNTCYMNSVLQALFFTRMFQSQVVATRKRNFQPILVSLQRVFRSLKLSKRSSISPRQFLDISRPPWFEAGQQQDCSEFLTFLLHTLEEEDKKGTEDDIDRTLTDMQWEDCAGDDGGKTVLADDQGGHDSGVDSGGEAGPDHSLVHAVFGGQLLNSYHCLECGNTSQGVTRFTDLPLAIPTTRQGLSMPDLPNLPNITITRTRHQLSVKDLLENYLEPEDLCEDNQYQCDICEGLRDAVKTTQIKAAPKHLIITLLRFEYDASTCQKVKLLTSVECPESLSLPLSGGEVVRYQLYCVVVHSGQSSEVGHYYSWVRGRQGVEWHKVSDEEVLTVPGKWDQEVQSKETLHTCSFTRRRGWCNF